MSLSVLLLVLHVCLALAIISLILLQKGAGASAGAAFGGNVERTPVELDSKEIETGLCQILKERQQRLGSICRRNGRLMSVVGWPGRPLVRPGLMPLTWPGPSLPMSLDRSHVLSR